MTYHYKSKQNPGPGPGEHRTRASSPILHPENPGYLSFSNVRCVGERACFLGCRCRAVASRTRWPARAGVPLARADGMLHPALLAAALAAVGERVVRGRSFTAAEAARPDATLGARHGGTSPRIRSLRPNNSPAEPGRSHNWRPHPLPAMHEVTQSASAGPIVASASRAPIDAPRSGTSFMDAPGQPSRHPLNGALRAAEQPPRAAVQRALIDCRATRSPVTSKMRIKEQSRLRYDPMRSRGSRHRRNAEARSPRWVRRHDGLSF